jgi:hypothetical protein
MKTVVVLGMHRSATSLVARTLHQEVHMGSFLLTGKKDNPKGHYENVDIIMLNDKILNDCGGSWVNPPPYKKIIELGNKYRDEMAAIIMKETKIANDKGLESWGFKDPRTCLTIDLWLPYLENPQFVVCYRNPMDIAKSLNLRNGTSIDYGIKLTNEYNRRIERFMRKWLKKSESE